MWRGTFLTCAQTLKTAIWPSLRYVVRFFIFFLYGFVYILTSTLRLCAFKIEIFLALFDDREQNDPLRSEFCQAKFEQWNVDCMYLSCSTQTLVMCECVQQNQDSINMDTVCRLYEVGRQRLAEEEEDEEDQVRLMQTTYLKIQLFLICFYAFYPQKCWKGLGRTYDRYIE